MIICRVLADDDDWDRVRDHWERLAELTPSITPWQSWDLLSRWWHTQRGSRQLRIVVVETDGVVRLLLPLQLSLVAPLRLRVLEPLGMSEEINRPRLALGMPDGELLTAALRLLWQRRHEWDALRIDEKIAGDPEVAVLREFARDTKSWLQAVPFHPCPYLQLNTPWEAYLRSRSPRLQKNLRAARRCLEARGTVTAERLDHADDVMRALDILIDLHGRSWKHADSVGLSQSNSYRAFYRDFVEVMSQRKQARAWVLKCDGRPIAATLAFHQDMTYYSAQIAHDEEFSKCSPGTLLEAIELEDLLVENRFRTYDFLGGALNNKLRWTSTSHPTERLWFVRKSLRGIGFHTAYFVAKPLLKRWRARSATA